MFGVSRRLSRKFSRNSSTSSLNSEKSRKISRSETSLIIRKKSSAASSIYFENADDSDVHVKEEYETHHKQQRRKDGLSTFMPQMYTELTKFLAQTRRRHSQKDEEDERWKNLDNKTVLLRYAVRSFDLQRVVQLLEANQVDVNEANRRGITALHEAAIDGNFACLKVLLDYNADINQTDNEGFTSLDYAVYGGNYDCASYLIERGANAETIKDGLMSFKPSLSPNRSRNSDLF